MGKNFKVPVGSATLYIYNLDSKGKPKAYGQGHPNMESAKKHLANLRKYYGKDFSKQVLGTKIVMESGVHKQLSSTQIIDKFFKASTGRR